MAFTRVFRIYRTVRRAARVGARTGGAIEAGQLPIDLTTILFLSRLAALSPATVALLLSLVAIGAVAELLEPSAEEKRIRQLEQIYGRRKAEQIVQEENLERTIELNLSERQG